MRDDLLRPPTILCPASPRVWRLWSVLVCGMIVLSDLPSPTLRAQPARFDWAQAVETLSRSSDTAFAVDSAGNAFLAHNGGALNAITKEYTIQAIHKFDPRGNLVWRRMLQTRGGVFGIAGTSDGGCQVVGFTATGVFTNSALASEGSGEVFLAKYNSGGDLRALRLASWNTSAYVIGAKLDPVGNVYTVANYRGAASFGGVALPIASTDWGNAALIAKCAPDGSPLWVRAVKRGSFYNGGQWAPFGYIAVDSLGDVFATITSSGSSATLGSTTVSGSPCFLAKYDPNGNLAWAKPLPHETPASTGYISAVGVDQDGNAFTLAWLRTSSGEFWSIAKWSAAGDLLWQQFNTARVTGNILDYVARPNGLAVDTAGNCVATVDFSYGPLTVGNDSFDSSSLYNFGVLKFSPSGDLRWELTAQADNGGRFVPTGLGAGPVGDYWVCAPHDFPVQFGETSLEPIGQEGTFFLARIVDNDTTMPRPAVQAARTANGIILSWPGTAAGFALETTASLSSPVNWVGLLDSGGVSNTNSIQITPTNPSGFYRLRQQ